MSDPQKQRGVDYFAQGDLVAVLTTQPLDRFLDYKAPVGGVRLGAYVEVPLGPRKVIGVVWGAGIGGYDPAKIRAVSNVLDVAAMRPEMRTFLERVGRYTLTPLHAMLRLATRAPGLGHPPSMRIVYALGDGVPDRMTPAREKVLAVLEDYHGMQFTARELAELAEVTPSVVKGLVKHGAVAELETPRDVPYPYLDHEHPSKALTDAQTAAGNELRASVAARAFSTTFLRGVTGSGKTEGYLGAV